MRGWDSGIPFSSAPTCSNCRHQWASIIYIYISTRLCRKLYLDENIDLFSFVADWFWERMNYLRHIVIAKKRIDKPTCQYFGLHTKTKACADQLRRCKIVPFDQESAFKPASQFLPQILLREESTWWPKPFKKASLRPHLWGINLLQPTKRSPTDAMECSSKIKLNQRASLFIINPVRRNLILVE